MKLVFNICNTMIVLGRQMPGLMDPILDIKPSSFVFRTNWRVDSLFSGR